MTAGERLGTFSFSYGSLAESPVTVLVFSLSGDVLPAGDDAIFSVTVDVPSGTAPGDYPLDVSGVVISTSDGEAVSSSGVDGVISVVAK
jgi:hypothetical protein